MGCVTVARVASAVAGETDVGRNHVVPATTSRASEATAAASATGRARLQLRLLLQGPHLPLCPLALVLRQRPSLGFWAFALLGTALTAPGYLVAGNFFLLLAVKLSVTAEALFWIKICAEMVIPAFSTASR